MQHLKHLTSYKNEYFLNTFCLFQPFLFSQPVLQEELRELRQQSIDPQAEQEIINGIEEIYFSNDSFDMVRHELEVRARVTAQTSPPRFKTMSETCS